MQKAENIRSWQRSKKGEIIFSEMAMKLERRKPEEKH